MEDEMRALIVYESMFGNTREIAEEMSEGMRPRFDASVVGVRDVTEEMVDGADLVVVGGPTHVHGMSNQRSREMAKAMAHRQDSGLTMERNAVLFGLRDWFKALSTYDGKVAAAFDTRGNAPAFLTGRASHAIARRLRRHHFHVAGTKSFVIDNNGHLASGELSRARNWGATLGLVASVSAQPPANAAA
jgi:flavodoxin